MFDTYLKTIAEKLLQARLDGQLLSQNVVYDLLQKHQPPGGLNISEWGQLSEFILKLELANAIPVAKALASEYNLDIVY